MISIRNIFMLNISHYKIIAIGKIKKKWIQEGIEMYLKRLPGLEVKEIKAVSYTHLTLPTKA